MMAHCIRPCLLSDFEDFMKIFTKIFNSRVGAYNCVTLT
jgi:hypothetical protein